MVRQAGCSVVGGVGSGIALLWQSRGLRTRLTSMVGKQVALLTEGLGQKSTELLRGGWPVSPLWRRWGRPVALLTEGLGRPKSEYS